MKVILTSVFVLSSAFFCGYAIHHAIRPAEQGPSMEITILRAEKDLSITPREIMYLQRRINWDI